MCVCVCVRGMLPRCSSKGGSGCFGYVKTQHLNSQLFAFRFRASIHTLVETPKASLEKNQPEGSNRQKKPPGKMQRKMPQADLFLFGG